MPRGGEDHGPHGVAMHLLEELGHVEELALGPVGHEEEEGREPTEEMGKADRVGN